MPSVADTRSGTITGAIGASGTLVTFKLAEWRLGAGRTISDISGFGDGGESFDAEGITNSVLTASGWLYAGTCFGAIFATNASIEGTVGLSSGPATGPIFTGTVKVTDVQVHSPYRDGRAVVTLRGKLQGGIEETYA